MKGFVSNDLLPFLGNEKGASKIEKTSSNCLKASRGVYWVSPGLVSLNYDKSDMDLIVSLYVSGVFCMSLETPIDVDPFERDLDGGVGGAKASISVALEKPNNTNLVLLMWKGFWCSNMPSNANASGRIWSCVNQSSYLTIDSWMLEK